MIEEQRRKCRISVYPSVGQYKFAVTLAVLEYTFLSLYRVSIACVSHARANAAASPIKLSNATRGPWRESRRPQKIHACHTRGSSFIPITFSRVARKTSAFPLCPLSDTLKVHEQFTRNWKLYRFLAPLTQLEDRRWFFDQLTLISSNHFHCAADGRRRRTKKPLHPLEVWRLQMVDTSRQ